MSTETQSPKPQWGLLATALWSLAIYFVMAVVQGVVIIVYLRVTGSAPDAVGIMEAIEENGTVLALATLAGTTICAPMILGIAALKRGSIADYLALKAPRPATLVLLLVITVVFIILNDLLTLSLGRDVVPPFMKATYASADPLWLLWVAVILCAPLLEELFFRGFLFKGLEPVLTGTGAIIVSAALWAVIHTQYGLYEKTCIFVMGLLLGYARARTGSLVPPLLMHATANLIATIEAAIVV
ncbi:MAG: CPBP family intramembrane glutamic endopeptidase [Pseudomonadota bacterium]